MRQKAWSDKQERRYDHIQEGLLERGERKDKAEEIAARAVNKSGPRPRAGPLEE